MAATVQSRNTYVSSTSDAGSFDLSGNMPSGISAGDLLLVSVACDQNPTVSAGSDWTKMGQASNSTVVTGAIFWKFAAGSDTITITTSSNQQISAVLLRISGGSTPTGSSANGSSTNSNPPSHTSGETSTLWIATRAGDSTVVATAAPASFGNLQTATAGGTSGASSNTAEQTTSNTTLNPGTFTSNTEQWVSWTIGIPDTPSDRPYVVAYGSKHGDNVTSLTANAYVPSGISNFVVWAYVATYDDVDETAGYISSVTFDGNTMTEYEQDRGIDGGAGGEGGLFVYQGAASGSKNIVASFGGNTLVADIHWAVLANASTTTNPDAHHQDSVSGVTTMTGSVTTITDKSIVLSGIGFGNIGNGFASGSDQWQIDSTNGGYVVSSFSKTAKTPAGSVSHDYQNGTTDSATIKTMSIEPYVAAGGPTVKTLAALGVG